MSLTPARVPELRPWLFVRGSDNANRGSKCYGPDVSYGYGVRVYTLNGEVDEAMHSGSGDDDHTGIVRSLRSRLTVVVLSNAGQHAGTTWSSFVARQLATRQ